MTVTFTPNSVWTGGHTADITITNRTSQAIPSWTLSFDFDAKITNLWNGTLKSSSGNHHVVSGPEWRVEIQPGQTISFGFQGTHTGTLGTPRNCVFNGQACSFEGSAPNPQPPAPQPPAPQPPAPQPPAPQPPAPQPPAPQPPPAEPGERVVTYFPEWARWRNRPFHVADIPGDKVTNIIYAFVNLTASGECDFTADRWSAIEAWYPGDVQGQDYMGHFNQLRKLKAAHPHVRTSIGVGGWTLSKYFSDAAATQAGREKMADSCADFMEQYGFDGIDIDWEYPVSGGLPDNHTRPEDKQNLTKLLRELREELDERGAEDGRTYDLSIATPAGPHTMQNMELDKVAEVVDWVNLMTYDFSGEWESRTGHNSPLYPSPTDVSQEFNADSAVRAYLANGIPASKIVPGVPFYGRSFKGVQASADGLNQPFSPTQPHEVRTPAAAPGTDPNEPSMLFWYDIKDRFLTDPAYQKHRSETGKVPYLYSPSRGVFITYDDPESVELKGAYARSKGLGGVMVWEISADDSQHSMLDALRRGFLTGSTPAPPAPSPPPAPTPPPPSPSPSPGSNPLAGAQFWVDPDSNAARDAASYRAQGRAADAALMDKIAGQPVAIWLGEWSGDIESAVDRHADRIVGEGKVPVFVAYNIPVRDCGHYSAGGLNNPAAYRAWIDGIVRGLAGRRAVVILEPDAVANWDCLDATKRAERQEMLAYAIDTLKASGPVAVYLDSAHSNWHSASEMASRLRQAGGARADGFALNVSNFRSTPELVSYGKQISAQLDGKGFVIDTSRNGNGPYTGGGEEWCNPPGRALGQRPTTDTGDPDVHAFLWIKVPGESDGSCRGAPPAGVWWPEYALGLASRASW